MKLVEVEGTHTVQTMLSSLDVHVGQSYSVLVTADQPPQDYFIAVSTRFASANLTTTALLRYTASGKPASGPLPPAPTDDHWSLNQARSIRYVYIYICFGLTNTRLSNCGLENFICRFFGCRTNLTASGPRPNPQGSYHYGQINVTRSIMLSNSPAIVNGKQRYAVNGVSFVAADTPLKLADYFNIDGVFRVGSIPDSPPGGRGVRLDTAVMGADYRSFIEIVFQNRENIILTWHLDGYSFFVVG